MPHKVSLSQPSTTKEAYPSIWGQGRKLQSALLPPRLPKRLVLQDRSSGTPPSLTDSLDGAWMSVGLNNLAFTRSIHLAKGLKRRSNGFSPIATIFDKSHFSPDNYCIPVVPANPPAS